MSVTALTGADLADDVVDAMRDKLNEAIAALNALTAGASGANLYDGTSFSWVNDWLVGAQLAVGNGWNGLALDTNYTLFLVGANTALTPVTGTGRLGVVTLDTGTTNTGTASIATAASISNVSGEVDDVGFEWVGGFPTLSTVGEEYNAQVGLVGNAPGYGVWFDYDRGNTNGANAGNTHKVSFVTMEGGVATRTLVDVTMAALSYPNTNLRRFKVVRDYANGNAKGYIDGVLVATHTTNLPTHSLAGSVTITKTAGTTARSIATDYTRLYVDMNTTRSP